MPSSLDDGAVRELRRAVRGTVHHRFDTGFFRHSQLFNAAVRSSAQLLVRPLDSRDVSEIVKFCARHDLSISAKSGGYGTHGWAVEGDVIIDMRLIAQIKIERPFSVSAEHEQDWLSLRTSPHVPVTDPDTLKGKARATPASTYPNAQAPDVGRPPIHAPFTEPRRRSADEAFERSPIVVVPPKEDAMHIDTNEALKADDFDRPSRRLRVGSPSSGRTSASHASSTSTPPTTESPDTPADENIKPTTADYGPSPPAAALPAVRPQTPKPSRQLISSTPPPPDSSSPDYSERPKSRTITADDVAHDEGMIPPSAERPGVGVDVRGYVGRDVGGWDTIWPGESNQGAAAESVGVTYVMNGGTTGEGTGSNWLWAPPSSALGSNPPALSSPDPTTILRSPPRPNARPFDFSDSMPVTTPGVNPFNNPHAASTPSLSSNRPFDFGPAPSTNGGGENVSSSTLQATLPTPGRNLASPAASSSASMPPTVTHVPFAPTAPVSHTYVSFGAGASQNDVDAFCATHPLAALVAREEPSPTDGSTLDGTTKVDGNPRSTVVADSARPDLYQFPAETTFGPSSGSFFGPGMSVTAAPTTSPQVPYFVPFAAHPVGSSVMLLGGFGFLSRLHGLSMDCLVEAEVVLPDGRIVWVSKDGVVGEDGQPIEEDPDDIWDEDDKGKTVGDGDKSNVQELAGDEETVSEKGKQREQENGEPAQPPTDEEPKPRPKRGLWWALRGAGPAFGIVVRYKAKAFPVPVVFAGNLIYNFNKSTAASLIKHFRDCIKSAPRELYANCILTAGPKNKGALVVIQICYAGSRAEGLPFLQAISSWEGEGCLLNEVQEKEFVWQQDSVAKVLKGGSGRKWFIRSDLIGSLTDEIIHRTVRKFGDTPDGCTWLFELAGGALVDTIDTCLPKVAREAAFTVVALHQWKLEEQDPACVITAEEWIKDTLSTQSTGGPFPCFLERRETRARVLGVYGRENWSRLCALKRKYDPRGTFKHNFWPLDEHGQPILDPKLMRPGAGGEMLSAHPMDSTLDDRGVPVPT